MKQLICLRRLNLPGIFDRNCPTLGEMSSRLNSDNTQSQTESLLSLSFVFIQLSFILGRSCAVDTMCTFLTTSPTSAAALSRGDETDVILSSPLHVQCTCDKTPIRHPRFPRSVSLCQLPRLKHEETPCNVINRSQSQHDR